MSEDSLGSKKDVRDKKHEESQVKDILDEAQQKEFEEFQNKFMRDLSEQTSATVENLREGGLRGERQNGDEVGIGAIYF
jgi:predicted RNA-binding protein with RPS1 domain